MIQKRYEADPLTCPQYRGLMRIFNIIEDQEVINKIPDLKKRDSESKPTHAEKGFLLAGTHETEELAGRATLF